MDLQMDLQLVTAPASPLLSLAEAWAHLRLDPSGDPLAHPEDTLIADLVAAVASEIDGRDGWLGRALVTQDWRLRLPAWPSTGRLMLPLPPFQSVQDFRVIDPSGDEVELVADADYVVLGTDPAVLVPAQGKCWPSLNGHGLPVSITFRCGYGAPSAVPAAIRAYARLRLGQLYEHREMVVVGTISSDIPFVRNMIDSWRWRGSPL